MLTGSNQMFCLVLVRNIAFNFLQDMQKLYTLTANTISSFMCGVPNLVSIPDSVLQQTILTGKQADWTRWRWQEEWGRAGEATYQSYVSHFFLFYILHF